MALGCAQKAVYIRDVCESRGLEILNTKSDVFAIDQRKVRASQRIKLRK